MSTNDLSFLVVGAGAIGGITAALLKKNGFDVEIVCKYDNYASIISEQGIEVNGDCGNFTVKIPAYVSVSDVREKNDINLHATTATDSMKLKIEVYGGRLDFRNFIKGNNLVDYFNGYIFRNAGRSGVPVPVNATIVNMIHEIEQNRRKISVSNFHEPLFDRFND